MTTLNQNPRTIKGRIRKQDLHIDFTPMVDLGFLLITFFMLTTSLSELHRLTISLPDETTHASAPSPIKATQAFTIILSKNNKVFYYDRTNVNKLSNSDFSENGIEKTLRQKSVLVNPAIDSIAYYNGLCNSDKISKTELQQRINHIANDKRNIFVFIKATAGAKYQNLIFLIDALNKNHIRHYAIDDLNANEN